MDHANTSKSVTNDKGRYRSIGVSGFGPIIPAGHKSASRNALAQHSVGLTRDQRRSVYVAQFTLTVMSASRKLAVSPRNQLEVQLGRQMCIDNPACNQSSRADHGYTQVAMRSS
jgi:hypothetical protein